MSGSDAVASAAAPEHGGPVVPENSSDGVPNTSTLAKGVMWLGAARWSSQVVAWVATLYMARILTTREYGAAGLVAVATSWAFALTEMGVGSAILAMRDDGRREQRTLHTIVSTVTLIGSILIALLAIPASIFVHDRALAPLLAVGGLLVFTQGLAVVPLALLQVRLDYRAVARIEFARSVSNTLLVAILALSGARVWSLPLASIGASLVQLLLARRAAPIALQRPDWKAAQGVLTYARHILLGRMAWNTYVNADVVMVGRALSTAVAGQYAFAWNIATLPGEKLVNVVQAVMGPFFAALAADLIALRKYFLLLTEGLALAVFPVFIGLVAVADEAIPLIFGDKWEPAVAPLRLLVIYALLQGINSVVGHVAAALRLARHTSRVNLVALFVLPPAFYLAATHSGLPAVATVWVCAAPFLAAYPLQLVLTRLGIGLREYLRALAAPTVAALLMIGAVLLMRTALPRPGIPALALIVDIAVGAITYPAALLLLFPSRVQLVMTTMRSVRSGETD